MGACSDVATGAASPGVSTVTGWTIVEITLTKIAVRVGGRFVEAMWCR